MRSTESINKKLNILIVSQYFWPENMRINNLVEGLIDQGHEVTVLTGLPNYPEGKLVPEYKDNKRDFNVYKGAHIIRVPMILRGRSSVKLVLNYLSFFISASILGSFKLRARRYDVIFVYAVSPIIAAIPALIFSRFKQAPVFLWILDLWPETLSAVGAVNNKFALRLMGRVVSWIYNRADYILMQSKSFKSNIDKYCTRAISQERLLYFPSWAEDIFNISESNVTKLLSQDKNFFTIMFAGNIGESQDFPTILDAFEKLQDHKNIRLIIVGDGRMAKWVLHQVKMRHLGNIQLLGKHPINEMPGLFACADVLFLSLKTNEIFSKTIPGKLQAYMASGKPLLGMIDGEAAEVILESKGGLVCSSGDVDGLVNNIIALSMLSLYELEKMGAQGKEFYKNNFESKQLFNKLVSLFQSATLRKQSYDS